MYLPITFTYLLILILHNQKLSHFVGTFFNASYYSTELENNCPTYVIGR